MDMLFSGFDYDSFGPMVRRGRFDQLLLRPVDITLQVLGSRFVLRRLGKMAEGLIIFFFGLSQIDVHWTAVCSFGGKVRSNTSVGKKAGDKITFSSLKTIISRRSITIDQTAHVTSIQSRGS